MFDHSMAAVTAATLWAASIGIFVVTSLVPAPVEVMRLSGLFGWVGSGLAAHHAANQVGAAYRAGWQAHARWGVRLVAHSGRRVK